MTRANDVRERCRNDRWDSCQTFEGYERPWGLKLCLWSVEISLFKAKCRIIHGVAVIVVCWDGFVVSRFALLVCFVVSKINNTHRLFLDLLQTRHTLSSSNTAHIMEQDLKSQHATFTESEKIFFLERQAPVVQKVYNAMHWINLSIKRIVQLVSLILYVLWITISPVDKQLEPVSQS